jgi:hypothetical protein
MTYLIERCADIWIICVSSGHVSPAPRLSNASLTAQRRALFAAHSEIEAAADTGGE